MKNDDGSYTFAPETIQVTEKQHNLTVKSDMLFLNETVFMERVQVYAYTQHSGETSRGSLISLRLNSAGVSEARVNLKRVEELNLMDADLTLTSQVKVMLISEVQIHLHLPKMALGENSVIIHALVVVLTTHDKNNTGYNHDQHFTVNYTKVEDEQNPTEGTSQKNITKEDFPFVKGCAMNIHSIWLGKLTSLSIVPILW